MTYNGGQTYGRESATVVNKCALPCEGYLLYHGAGLADACPGGSPPLRLPSLKSKEALMNYAQMPEPIPPPGPPMPPPPLDDPDGTQPTPVELPPPGGDPDPEIDPPAPMHMSR